MLDRSAQARRVRKLSLAVSLPVLGFALAAGLPLPDASASAQIAPPNRSELVPPERRERREGPTLTIDGDLERAPCALDREEYADIRLTLKGAEFAGLERVPGLSLESAYDSYVGRELPLSVLCDIRAEANATLRRAGYLASVEIPEQNLSDGVADFRVIFGRLTALRVRGDAGPSERVVARYLDNLTGAEVFNSNEAERYLLLADDLPGVDVRLSLRPAAGGEPGDLVGEIAVVRQRGIIDVNVQNFGSNAIGRFGGLLRGELYDLTGLGDRTTVTFFTTAEFEEQQTLQLGHDFAVGGEGLRLGAGLTLSQTSPELGLAGLDIDSQTLLASVYASYPLMRTRKASAFLEAGFDLVNQDVDANDIRLTEDRVRMIYARISGEWTDGESVRRIGGYTPYEPRWRAYYAGELRQGLDVFSASPDCRPNLLACLIGGTAPPSRVEADPTPFLVRYQAGAEYRPDPLLTFSLEARAQATNDPLPAFEEFAGGSFSIGRGYDPGAILGDSGVGGSFEVRYGTLAPQGPEAIAWQPYVFTDVAWVWNEDPSRSPLNPDRLWSAGGGVRAAFGSMMQGDFLIAVPLERPDLALERGDVRIMFSLTARLFPWRY
ncbi:MAG: ShlB/FhaC/HecB family hemolysin secretion/activation protein [Erythrobacter sp.]|nr:MAG: ShlB/FhaC/HecB family hemolysin secretion/activation protein [Erythrobacter sp.]